MEFFHKILAIAVVFGAIVNLAESADCQTCIKKIDENLPAIKEAMKQNGPVLAKYTLPCNPCKLSGLEEMTRAADKEICPRNLPNGDIAMDVHVNIPNVTLECECDFNLIHIVKYAQQISSAFRECPASSFLEAVQTMLVVPPPPSTLAEVAKLPQCLQSLNAILSKAKMYGKLVSKLPNLIARGTVTSPPGNGKVGVSNIVIMNEDISQFNLECSGDEDFSEICSCLSSNNFVRYLGVKITQMQIACNAEQEYPKYQNLIDKLNCNE